MLRRPNLAFEIILQNGDRAVDLCSIHPLGDRLPTGYPEALSADLQLLRVQVPDAERARTDSKAATGTQKQRLVELCSIAVAVRTAVARSHASADVARHYGVGVPFGHTVVNDVNNAAEKILERATAHPDEARSLGIMPSDLDALRARLVVIHEADEVQERALRQAPEATRARNATARRVLKGIDRIVGAGMMQFADSPVRAEFEALIGRGRRRRRGGTVPPVSSAA